MMLTIRILGAEILHITTDAEPEPDAMADLSGGSIGCDRIDAGPTEMFMGFANGRGDDG